MKLLITGADGQLGTEVQKACVRRDMQCLPTDLSTLDITDLAAVRACVSAQRPDAVINCAAFNDVDRAESQWQAAWEANALGPRNLALATEEAGVPIMHFSTDYVFDGEKGSPYTLADRPDPVSRYGDSKLLGERWVAGVTNRYYVVRLSWVYGPGERGFPTRALRWARQQDTLRIARDQVSCPTYAVDLAEPVLDLLETGAYGLYQLTSQEYCSRFDWIRRLMELAGLSTRVVPVASEVFKPAARRPRFSAMDSFPLPRMLGYHMPSWEDGTARFLKDTGVTT